MESWRKHPLVFAVFSVPGIAWLLLFFFAPLAIIFLYSFGENVSLTEVRTTWTLENYERIFVPEIMVLLWRTLWLTVLTTVVTIVVAFPVALVIATAQARWKPWLLLVIILPFWTNLLIRTYALLNILGARGRLNGLLKWLWEQANAFLAFIGVDPSVILGARFVPVKFLGTEFGVVFGMVYVALPFAVLPIYASLERMDRSYLEASLDLGASQMRTFFRVLVPLASSGIVTAAIITFIPTLGQFLTPELLGRGQVDMISNVIVRQFKRANDWPFGSALSMALLYVTFIILAARSFHEMARAKRRAARA